LLPGFDWKRRLLFVPHHASHAASAFYPSPFKTAAVITIDGVGEWTTTSTAEGIGSELNFLREIRFPHSLGLLYAAFTAYVGFKVNSGEYKLMGLAPYGTPRFARKIFDRLIDVKPDGSFRLNMDYFSFWTGAQMVNEKFCELFGGPSCERGSRPTQRECDLAASIQQVTEEVVCLMVSNLLKVTGHKSLCLAGGVALNCVANGRLLRNGIVKNLWVQPASGDAGGALGAALYAHYALTGAERVPAPKDGMEGSLLGPGWRQNEIEQQLTDCGARFEILEHRHLIDRAAQALADQRVIGWFQGRMEYGPRALGNRSILADPRPQNMQSVLNRKIKFRESFRPFAPAVLKEEASHWFDLDVESPYMLLVAPVSQSHWQREENGAEVYGRDAGHLLEDLWRKRSAIPAVTHVDYSARVQTVDRRTNAQFHNLLARFAELTGCPILVNTSFNVRGEPIVCTPSDAFDCFMGTDLDCLVIGNCYLDKRAQDSSLVHRHRDRFEPD
jgi:carbamoyltransferase